MPNTSINSVDLDAVQALVGAIQRDPSQAATTWEAEVTWRAAFRSEATVRDFPPVASDEPVGLGGTDTAPNPVEQLLAALGNCLAVGYAANASVAGLTIEQLRIRVSGDLDLRTFLGLDQANAGFQAIHVDVDLDTDGTAEQEAELHERVVATSPVGHTLGRSVPLHIELAAHQRT